MNLDDIDLTQSSLYRQGFPHDVFTTLREQAPVWRHPKTEGLEQTCGDSFWVLSRFEDIRNVNRRADVFLSKGGAGLGYEATGLMLTDMDGQTHIRQRKLISSGFTPRMTKRLEDQARGWAVRIIDDALARENVEFVQEIAYQLPMHMIADMLGIPTEDRDWLFALVNDMLLCIDPEHPVSESEREGLGAQIFGYGKKISAQKREAPTDDILSLLATASDERGNLSDLELEAFFMLLTVAGSETTRNAIASGLHKLLAEPEQFDALRRDPSLLKRATDEIIRWTSPVAYFKRVAAEDTEVSGVPIAKGERLTLWYPSGNRDAGVFDAPNRFDIARPSKPQLAFGGGGAHFCLGAHLARLETQIAIGAFVRRFDEIELQNETTEWGRSLFRVPGRIPVRFVDASRSQGSA